MPYYFPTRFFFNSFSFPEKQKNSFTTYIICKKTPETERACDVRGKTFKALAEHFMPNIGKKFSSR